jgi:hypothetical protein
MMLEACWFVLARIEFWNCARICCLVKSVLNDFRAAVRAVNRDLNQWELSGPWNVGAESAVLGAARGKIVFRFHARDLHMVLGPTRNGKPVRFKVKLDGTAPSRDFGVDSAPDGTGEVRRPRLYQLIRQKGQIQDRTFEIDFLDPGVHAYMFTFG